MSGVGAARRRRRLIAAFGRQRSAELRGQVGVNRRVGGRGRLQRLDLLLHAELQAVLFHLLAVLAPRAHVVVVIKEG